MDRFAVVDLTSARRPVLGQDEIEHVIQRRVGLYFKYAHITRRHSLTPTGRSACEPATTESSTSPLSA